MKLMFKGIREPLGEANVVLFTVDDGKIWANVPKYFDEVYHSPDGFEWGYGGSGPAQLAYALLRTYFRAVEGDDTPAQAMALYQRFKWDAVTKLGYEYWELSSETISMWLEVERGKNARFLY